MHVIGHDYISVKVTLLAVQHFFDDLSDLSSEPLRTLQGCVQVAIHPDKRRAAIHFSRRRVPLPRQAAVKTPSDK